MESFLPVAGRQIESVVFRSERTSQYRSPRGRGAHPLAPEIEADLERVYGRVRAGMGYKRKELAVDLSEPLAGRLSAPDFDYSLRLSDEGGEVTWVREVAVRSLDQALREERLIALFSEEMDDVVVRFSQPLDVAELVDRVEERETDDLTIDYDMQCRWCEISPKDSPAVLRVEGHELRLRRKPGAVVPLSEMLHLLTNLESQGA